MPNLSEQDSLLLQCLATTALLAELSNADFLKSAYFENLSFVNRDIKHILKISGIGNPAAMQMMLYALLTVPKELLSKTDYEEMENIFAPRINTLARSLVEKDTVSTYAKEETLDKIDYLRHIRNSVAHARCHYTTEGSKYFVTFKDCTSNETKQCSIKMECQKVGLILMELQRLIMEHYNKNYCLS